MVGRQWTSPAPIIRAPRQTGADGTTDTSRVSGYVVGQAIDMNINSGEDGSDRRCFVTIAANTNARTGRHLFLYKTPIDVVFHI